MYWEKQAGADPTKARLRNPVKPMNYEYKGVFVIFSNPTLIPMHFLWIWIRTNNTDLTGSTTRYPIIKESLFFTPLVCDETSTL